MKPVKSLILILAGILAFFSFAISYTSMKALAFENGIEPAFLFPLIIDGVILLALIYRLYGEDRDTARLIMAIYVLMSIGFNALAHMNPVSGIMAAIAPISLFVTSEVAASMLRCKGTDSPKRDSKGRFIKKEE